MRILRGGATEDAAAPVAASSTAMPGAFDLDPPGELTCSYPIRYAMLTSE